MNNMLMADTPLEKVRKHPATVFNHDGIEGVQVAFRGLLDIFGQEAKNGHAQEIEIYFSEAEPDLEIRMKGDRGLQLGETHVEGAEWKKRLTELVFDIENYQEFLFSNGREKLPYNYTVYDSIYFYPMLVCNQFVSEEMTVTSKAADNETEKFIRFREGEAIGDLNERAGGETGTRIRWRYDRKVFSEVQLSREFMEKCLEDASAVYSGVKLRLFVKNSSCDEQEEKVFFYEDSFEIIERQVNGEYFDLFNSVRELTGKDNAIHKREYTAVVNIIATFAPDASMLRCYFNRYKLEEGGFFVDEFFKGLDKQIKLLCRNNGIEADIPVEMLRQHTAVLFRVSTVDCVPDWRDGRRTALDNRMLVDMTEDICEKTLKYFMDYHEKDMCQWVNMILDKMKS